MIPYSDNIGASNKLLSITNMCNEGSLIAFADRQKDVDKLLQTNQGAVLDILKNSLYKSASSRNITSVQWPMGETMIAFDSPNCMIESIHCSQKVKEVVYNKSSYWSRLRGTVYDDLRQDTVNVRFLDLGWMFASRQ